MQYAGGGGISTPRKTAASEPSRSGGDGNPSLGTQHAGERGISTPLKTAASEPSRSGGDGSPSHAHLDRVSAWLADTSHGHWRPDRLGAEDLMLLRKAAEAAAVQVNLLISE